MSELRLYGPDELGPDGYPFAWHRGEYPVPMMGDLTDASPDASIKEWVRELAGYRCERCGHPYPPGIADLHPRGEWTPCDEQCIHGGPVRSREASLGDEGLWVMRFPRGVPVGETLTDYAPGGREMRRWEVEAHWRILTTHHLNGVKWDCRWWNLAPLCQRCHLAIQGKVVMERVYLLEHSDWFKPYAAGWYASAYLGEELTRDEVLARLDELLALERQA